MSDAQNPHDRNAPQGGPAGTSQSLILTVAVAFLATLVLAALLVVYVMSGSHGAPGSGTAADEAVARRIERVGSVGLNLGTATAGAPRTGEQVFTAQCTTCHTAGMLGAPKFGDAAAWGPRIATGYEALLHSALAGKGNMTPQGGAAFSDLEVGRAVVYMANKAGAKFEEPKAPAGTPAPAGDAPAAAAAPVAAAAATVAVAAVKSAEPAKVAAAAGGAAPALYTQVCQVCHATGVAGAPKFGDKAAWAPRIGQGIDGLTANAIKGKNAMPPKGGSQASEAEIKAVVTYMVGAAK